MGWIQVERRGTQTRIILDPYAVRYDGLSVLPTVLADRRRGRAVQVVLSRQGVPTDAPVTFLSNEGAVAYIHGKVKAERGALDAEPPIDVLAKGLAPEPQAREDGGRPVALPTPQIVDDEERFAEPAARRTGDAQDRFARPMEGLEKALQTGTSVSKRLVGGRWLTDERHRVSSLEARLGRDEPDTVLFALHTRGWVGVETALGERENDLRSVVPARIVMDPNAVDEAALASLVSYCEDWADVPFAEITLVWWDGISWVMEYGTAEQLASRATHLYRSRQEAYFPSTLQSIAMDPDTFSIQGNTGREMFDTAMRIWRSYGGHFGRDGSIMEALRGAGLLRARSKLLTPDENNEFRIAHYDSGGHSIWTQQQDRSMVGKRLVDVPDRKLGASVQSDLLTVLRWDRPLVHRCEGFVQRDTGPAKVSWARLTLPIANRRQPPSLLTIVNVDRVLATA